MFVSFFFFQAEDGIRDHCVTGVQTCALPISLISEWIHNIRLETQKDGHIKNRVAWVSLDKSDKIGRASCRERV